MKIALPSLTAIRGLPGGELIAQAFQDFQAAVVAGWETNHDADGNHTEIYSSDGVFTALGQPRVRIFQLTPQTIATGVDTDVIWTRSAGNATDPEEYDTDQQFDGTTAIVCARPGLYLAMASIGWDANATGSRATGIYSQRAAATIATARALGDATNGPPQQIVCPVYVAPDTVDSLRVQVTQTSGVNRTVTGWFSVIKVS